MTLYRNKYRVETTRLKNWDYASDGWYYITICTKNREHLLCEINQGTIHLNQYGLIAEQCWVDLPNHYSNLILDTYVIMPDHLHGIMIIDNSRGTVGSRNVDGGGGDGGVDGGNDGGGGGDHIIPKPVITDSIISNPAIPNPIIPNSTTKNPKTPHGIFEFIRAFKTFSSRHMNELNNTPGKKRWQTRFYDHIIFNEQELHRIRQYILNNPSKWGNVH